MGNLFTSNFLKARGRFALPMMRGRSNSPIILQHNSTVNRSFETFPPLHVSFLNAIVLLGRTLKRSPVLL